MSSDITYERTIEMNYGAKLSDVMFAKLAKKLQDKGISLLGRWDSKAPVYGYNTVERTVQQYVITLGEKDVFVTKYQGDANDAFNAFSPLIDGLEQETRTVTTTSKKWIEVEGSRMLIDLDLDGEQGRYYDKPLHYNNDLQMEINLSNGSSGLKLTFIVTWTPEGVQRKDAIEARMVDEVLNDMGLIQGTIEGRLKLKEFGFDVDNAEISCHFDAKTESRSECAPDIINRVKEAKRDS
jgi:hypothetical protein